jgi:hypothetical protein
MGLVGITLNGPFSVIDAWSSSMTYCGRKGNRNASIPDSPGLSEEEAFPVYVSLDEAFISVFPEFGTYDRKKASEYIQEIFRKVYKALISGNRVSVTDEIRTLLTFSEEFIKALEACH